jgi:hypothetical protein
MPRAARDSKRAACGSRWGDGLKRRYPVSEQIAAFGHNRPSPRECPTTARTSDAGVVAACRLADLALIGGI